MVRSHVMFYGIAYNVVVKGESKDRVVTSNLNSRQSLYHDEAIRLSERDLRENSFVGKPIYVEHMPGLEAGIIRSARVGSDGHLHIAAKVYTDTPMGKDLGQRLREGSLRGLSVGYSVGTDNGTNRVTHKNMQEISLVKEPFFKGCNVLVAASKKRLPLSIHIMATTTTETTPIANPEPPKAPETPAPTPEQAPPKQVPEKEIMSMIEEAAQKNEELQKKLAQLQQENDKHRAREQAQRKLYQEKQAVVASQVLASQAAQFGGDLPKEYSESLTKVILSPESASTANIWCTQGKNFSTLQQDLEAKTKELEALRAKLSEFEATHSVAASRLGAMRAQNKWLSTPDAVERDSAKLDDKGKSEGAPTNWHQMFEATDNSVSIHATHGVQNFAELDMAAPLSDFFRSGDPIDTALVNIEVRDEKI